ncbi:MAG: phosphatidate cytidylyltransferase [Alphaproteobacteria bacterium]
MADASAATVRRLAPAELVHSGPGPNALQLRILSSLVLAPVAIGAVWFGWPFLPVVTAAAAAVMAWEWGRLCRVARSAAAASRAITSGTFLLPASGLLLIGAVLAAVAAAAIGAIAVGIGLCVAGAAAVFMVARREHGAHPAWLALGAVWIALPCVLLLWLAQRDQSGQATLLWILAVVWATDIGAYAFGSRIGGPRLAPRWSPRKTWAGLLGGVLCAALAGGAAGWLFGGTAVLPLVILSAALAIVGQFGDLAESAAKRRFGVKDSSDLIPGHGGLLDRLDGLLAVIPAVALLAALRGGSVLAWS